MKEISLKECQKYSLDIAKRFHKLCKDNQIPYYMIGGTLLGAVRHKGFIPWDDDMDFGIPRSYYDHFVNVCYEQLEPPYKIVTVKEFNLPMCFVKIENTNTRVDSLYSPNKRAKKLGIFIDIYPIDDCGLRSTFARRLLKYNKILVRIEAAIFYESEKNTLQKAIGRNLLRRVFRRRDANYWVKKHDYLLSKFVKTGSDGWANFNGMNFEREIIDKRVWGSPILYSFEDTQLYGPVDYDSFLKQIYGNYMRIPSESERHVHASSYYKK